jgi:hypothetical protein
MTTVKLDFKANSVPVKLEKAAYYVQKMTGNPNFPSPSPLLSEITAAIEALRLAAANATDGGKTLKIIKDQKEEILDDLITRLGAYVQDESKGDELIILSAGMEVRKKATPIGELPAPENFIVENDTTKGSMKLKWDVVPGKSSYIVQYAQAGEATLNWQLAGVPTAAKIVIENLKPGSVYAFRVAAVGAAGQSDWSNVVDRMAI